MDMEEFGQQAEQIEDGDLICAMELIKTEKGLELRVFVHPIGHDDETKEGYIMARAGQLLAMTGLGKMGLTEEDFEDDDDEYGLGLENWRGE